MTKSTKSALLLSAAAVFSFAATSAVLNILLPYLLTGDVHTIIGNPERLSQPGQGLVLTGMLSLFLPLLIGLGAFWLYRFFGEAYYGSRSAARWSVFGMLLALLLKLPNWLSADGLRLVKYAVWIASPFIAFFLARWLLPLKRMDD